MCMGFLVLSLVPGRQNRSNVLWCSCPSISITFCTAWQQGCSTRTWMNAMVKEWTCLKPLSHAPSKYALCFSLLCHPYCDHFLSVPYNFSPERLQPAPASCPCLQPIPVWIRLIPTSRSVFLQLSWKSGSVSHAAPPWFLNRFSEQLTN